MTEQYLQPMVRVIEDDGGLYLMNMQVTSEQISKLREVQSQGERDHDDGFDAGGPVDETRSEAFQFGQVARQEVEEFGE